MAHRNEVPPSPSGFVDTRDAEGAGRACASGVDAKYPDAEHSAAGTAPGASEVDELAAALEHVFDPGELARLLELVRTDPDALRDALGGLGGLRYGLAFTRRALAETFPVRLVQDRRQSVAGIVDDSGAGALVHRFIEGDNLPVSAALMDDLAGQCAVCYLDPPYNTGKGDFPYLDRFGPRGEGSVGAHTAWLSYMEPRIRAGRDALRDDGVMFISIDVRELWGLKLLCDEIFGEASFLGMISVKVKAPAGLGQHGAGAFDVCEYVLAYVRDPGRKPPSAMRAEPIDPRVAGDYARALVDMGERREVLRDGSVEDGYVLYAHENHRVVSVPAADRTATKMRKWLPYAFRTSNAQGVGRFAQHVPAQGLASVEFIPRRGRWEGVRHQYVFLNGRLVVWLRDSAHEQDGQVFKRGRETNLWHDNLHQGLGAEGGVRFVNGKKPVAMLMRLLELSGHRDGVVLDLFGGSGSMGEAVVGLNARDGGERQFVIVTSNAGRVDGRLVEDAGDNGIARAVTIPRLRGLFTGVRPDGVLIPRARGRLNVERAVQKRSGRKTTPHGETR